MVVIAAKLIFGLDSDFVLKELLSFLEQKKMPSIIYGRKFCPVGLFPAPIYIYWFSMNRQKYTWQGTGNIKVPYSPARWDTGPVNAPIPRVLKPVVTTERNWLVFMG